MPKPSNVTSLPKRPAVEEIQEKRRGLAADLDVKKLSLQDLDRLLGGAVVRGDELEVRRIVSETDRVNREIHLLNAAVASLNGAERRARADEITAERAAYNQANHDLHGKLATAVTRWSERCREMAQIATEVLAHLEAIRASAIKQCPRVDAFRPLHHIPAAMVEELVLIISPPDEPTVRQPFRNLLPATPLYENAKNFLAHRTPTHLLKDSLTSLTVVEIDEAPPPAAA